MAETHRRSLNFKAVVRRNPSLGAEEGSLGRGGREQSGGIYLDPAGISQRLLAFFVAFSGGNARAGRFRGF